MYFNYTGEGRALQEGVLARWGWSKFYMCFF